MPFLTPCRFAILSVAAALSLTIEASAETLILEPGEGSTLGTDTHLQQAQPDRNNGGESILAVDADDPSGTGADRQTLISITGIFGGGPGQIPPDASIRSATLELKISNGGDAFALHRMVQDWDDTATWNSLLDGVQVDGVEALTDPDYVTDFVNSGTLKLDVTKSLRQWQAVPNSNRGWALMPTGNNGVRFNSVESSNPPRLVVELDVGEPRSLSFDPAAGYGFAEDTYLQAASADANNGDADTLNVDGDDPSGTGKDVQVLLRFDEVIGDEPAQVATDATVTSALLHLYVSNPGHPITLHRLLRDWTEDASWNSMTAGIQTDDIEALAAEEAKTAWVRPGKLTLDVTASVRAWQVAPETNYGWVLLPTKNNGVDFHSTEGAVPPRLVVETTGNADEPPDQEPTPVSVSATVETDPVPSNGDAADDVAIWIHPEFPAQSRVIGTEKRRGLAVYDLDGNELQFLADGRMNNVDLRYNFSLGGEPVDLVAASERGADTIAVYTVRPSDGLLEKAHPGNGIASGLDVYGLCMYQPPATGELFVFVTAKSGEVEQWALFDDGNGFVGGVRVRDFDVGTQVEGCVADDDNGRLYVGEENVGIWRYGAEPGAGEGRTLVDRTGPNGQLTADVEGLTIYHVANGSGYLIASSQGSNSYVVYERGGDNDYLGTFVIEPGNGVDGTEITDGIDVSNASLGPVFPSGVFIAHDTYNPGGNQNFKLVPWNAVAEAFPTPLTVDTAWNARR